MSNSDFVDTNVLNYMEDSTFVANVIFPIKPVFLITQETSKDTLVVISDMSLVYEENISQTLYDLAQHIWIFDTDLLISYNDHDENIINIEPYTEPDRETFKNYYYLEVRAMNPYYDAEMDRYLMNDWSYLTNEYGDDLMYVSTSIRQLTSEEERVVYKSLRLSVARSLSDSYIFDVTRQHRFMCIQHEVACPFWNTQCRWFDTIPKITEHILFMHGSRVVNREKVTYRMDVSMIESLAESYKLAQRHGNRIFLISIAGDSTWVYVTVHATCASAEDHYKSCWAYLTTYMSERQSPIHWHGFASPLSVTPAQLQAGNCLIFPKPTRNFTLTVQLGCS